MVHYTLFVSNYFTTSQITRLRPGLDDTERLKVNVVSRNNMSNKMPTAIRIELGSQKLPSNISVAVRVYNNIIDQSILGRSNALITPLKCPVLGGFHLKPWVLKFARPK